MTINGGKILPLTIKFSFVNNAINDEKYNREQVDKDLAESSKKFDKLTSQLLKEKEHPEKFYAFVRGLKQRKEKSHKNLIELEKRLKELRREKENGWSIVTAFEEDKVM